MFSHFSLRKHRKLPVFIEQERRLRAQMAVPAEKFDEAAFVELLKVFYFECKKAYNTEQISGEQTGVATCFFSLLTDCKAIVPKTHAAQRVLDVLLRARNREAFVLGDTVDEAVLSALQEAMSDDSGSDGRCGGGDTTAQKEGQ